MTLGGLAAFAIGHPGRLIRTVVTDREHPPMLTEQKGQHLPQETLGTGSAGIAALGRPLVVDIWANSAVCSTSVVFPKGPGAERDICLRAGFLAVRVFRDCWASYWHLPDIDADSRCVDLTEKGLEASRTAEGGLVRALHRCRLERGFGLWKSACVEGVMPSSSRDFADPFRIHRFRGRS